MPKALPVIRDHFVNVDSRWIHYRQAGSGSVVVMIHASPNSAKVMEPIQQVFATDFATIAVDIPGMGLSEPLGQDLLSTEHLADAIVAFLDTLHIEQAAFYGRHTGAGIAVEIAHRHPERVSMVLTDGFPVFAQRYSEERLDEYLGQIEPWHDGSHLAWLWMRSRDIHIFWPWDKRALANRAQTDVPSVESIHRCALELLEAGNGFRKVYASAFRHAGLSMIDEVSVPVCYGNRPGDSQFHTMARYPETAWTREFARETLSAAMQEREVLKRHPARSSVRPSDGDFDNGSPTPELGFLDWGDEQVLVRTRGLDREGIPILLLHDIPGSSALHLELLEELGREAPVVAIDLAGQGESRIADAPSVARWAQQIEHVCRSFDISQISIVAIGGAATAAVEFALQCPELVGKLVLQSPPALTNAERQELEDRYAVAADPQWDGTHLLRVYHHLRDQELWWPWFDRRAATARQNEPRLDPEHLTLRLRECVKQPLNYKPTCEAVLSYPLLERMTLLQQEVAIVYNDMDLFSGFHEAAAKRTRSQKVCNLPSDIASQAAILLRLIAG